MREPTIDDEATLERMRALGRSGCDVRTIVSCVRESCGENVGVVHTMLYFMDAFGLSLTELRPLQGSTIFGNAAYSEAETNARLLPLIAERLKAIPPAPGSDPGPRSQ